MPGRDASGVFEHVFMTTPSSSALEVASASLLQLFAGPPMDGSPRGRLRLPEYQRPYRWTSEQVAQLAADLSHHQEQPRGHDYYLGSLILHQGGDGCPPARAPWHRLRALLVPETRICIVEAPCRVA